MSDFGTKRRRKILENLVIEAEFRRCQRDKTYAYSHYFYVPVATEVRGRRLFQLWDFQHEIQTSYDSNDRVVVLKTRQIGATTLAMADSFHNGFFNPNRYELLVVSRSQEDARTNLSMIDHIWEFLPRWMKRRGPERTDDTTERITFRQRDGSMFRAVSIPGTASRGAGKTANRVVLDEFALMEKQSEVYRALEPATAAAASSPYKRGAVFVVLSTPRGGRNIFAQQWLQAHRQEIAHWKALYFPVTCNKFIAGEVAADAAREVEALKAAHAEVPFDLEVLAESFWSAWRAKGREEGYAADPATFYSEYSRTWEEALRESGRVRFPYLPDHSECPPFAYAGFLKTANGVVDVELAEQGEDFLSAPWQFSYLPEEWPRDRQVVLAADTASGQLGDYSAAVVLATSEGPEGEDAAEILAAFWSNTVSPAEFADELVRAGRYFKSAGRTAAMAVVERPPGGAGDGEVIARMKQLRYPSDCMFRYEAKDRVTARKRPVYGWPTDRATKPEAVRALARLLTGRPNEKGDMEPYTLLYNIFPELRDELGAFVVLNKPEDRSYEKLGGDAGTHDDLVMATAMGVAVLERVRKGRSKRTEVRTTGGTLPKDGPILLWNPQKVLADERDKADRHRQKEIDEWQRTQRDRDSMSRLEKWAREQ